MRTDQLATRLKISSKLIGLRMKWLVQSLLSVCGFGLVLAGGFPIFEPLIATEVPIPDTVISVLPAALSTTAITYIAGGAILVWVTTKS